MNARQVRLGDTFEAIGGPLARLRRSLREDGEAILVDQVHASGAQLLASDAFLQRFQQTTDLALRKLLPRFLAVLEESDQKVPFAAVFDRLDGYGVISDVPWWIELNALRNRLIHEYAMLADARASELQAAWRAAARLVDELDRIRTDHAMVLRGSPK